MTPEQIEEAQKLVLEGKTYLEIAQILQVPNIAVSSTLGALGMHRDKLRWRRTKIWDMTGEGRPIEEICEAVGLSRQSVQAITMKQKNYRPFR